MNRDTTLVRAVYQILSYYASEIGFCCTATTTSVCGYAEERELRMSERIAVKVTIPLVTMAEVVIILFASTESMSAGWERSAWAFFCFISASSTMYST